jgi:hypothetical protein
VGNFVLCAGCAPGLFVSIDNVAYPTAFSKWVDDFHGFFEWIGSAATQADIESVQTRAQRMAWSTAAVMVDAFRALVPLQGPTYDAAQFIARDLQALSATTAAFDAVLTSIAAADSVRSAAPDVNAGWSLPLENVKVAGWRPSSMT